MTAAEALRRYHVAEKRLAEVETLIEQWKAWTAFDRRSDVNWHEKAPPMPSEPLEALYIERDRLQAESFRVFTESRKEA